ncbi:SIR2-like domain-containing protein [Nemania sp. FL0031]|nr:SIR2-like domain-containing protein [Nemania sp. FL0031]
MAKQILYNDDIDKPDHLIPAATTLKRCLQKVSGRYAAWLQFQFRDLYEKVTDHSALDSLKALHARGAYLITTNYDDLLERKCGLQPCDSTTENALKKFVAHKRKEMVFHPHGYWEHTESVVLASMDYIEVQRHYEVQRLLRSLRETKTILFIGYGSSLPNPNFGELLGWVRDIIQGRDRNQEIARRHYILLRRGDKNPVPNLELNEVFCRGYDDIGPWLESLMVDELKVLGVPTEETSE